jgi:hypothetical protein
MINNGRPSKFYCGYSNLPMGIISRICNYIFLSLFILFLLTSCKKTNINEVSGPVINNVNPSHGTEGSLITLTGNYFGETVANNKVTFDGTVAVVNSASKTQLTVTAPPHLSGTAEIKIMVNGKESRGVSYEYN